MAWHYAWRLLKDVLKSMKHVIEAILVKVLDGAWKILILYTKCYVLLWFAASKCTNGVVKLHITLYLRLFNKTCFSAGLLSIVYLPVARAGTIPEDKKATPVANTSTTNASLQNAVPVATNVPRLKLMLQFWMYCIVVKFYQKRSKKFRRNYSTSRSTWRVFNEWIRAVACTGDRCFFKIYGWHCSLFFSLAFLHCIDYTEAVATNPVTATSPQKEQAPAPDTATVPCHNLWESFWKSSAVCWCILLMRFQRVDGHSFSFRFP